MNSPATLLLVRHAAADCVVEGRGLLCGSYDAPLSAEGRRQVALLRERLYGELAVDAAYASPLRRALETSAAAPEPLRRSTRIVRSLAEIHCGAVDGRCIDDVRQRYPELWLENEAQVNEDFAWPGGESYRAFRKRVLDAVNAIAHAHMGQRVLVFTHAGVVNQVLGSLQGQSAARWEFPRPRNASLTKVIWAKGEGAVICFDDCDHLHTDLLVRA